MRNSRSKPLVSISIYMLLSMCVLQSCKEKNPAHSSKSSSETKQKELTFLQRKIADDAKFWWAHTPIEITGDEIVDLVFIHNNSSGGYLGYYEGQTTAGLWKLHKVADQSPTGAHFAGGDLECADIDGDGDNDILAIQHPGEWVDADAQATLFWYENPDWIPHTIGRVPDAVKDVSFADFDDDGKLDLSVLTFEEHTLSIFKQHTADTWDRVQFVNTNPSLHEGMDTGDIDGDHDIDIVANGFVFYNPGKELTQVWEEENIDSIWNNQEGDWSRNGTKIFLKDLDHDGMDEIFISHSERAGYPLKLYRKVQGMWHSSTISDSIPACHTLQVYDFDKDGDDDVLAGINRARAVNLKKDHYEITVFLSDNEYKNWTPKLIGSEGIYNGQAVDYDGDGDIDIFRYPDHEASDFYILENRLENQ